MTTQRETSDGLSGLSELMSDERNFTGWQVDPSVRRSRRRRVLLVTAIVLAVLLAGSGGYVFWALTAPVAAPTATWQAPAVPTSPPAALGLPADGAAAVSISGGDAYLGPAASGVWLSSGTNEPRSIASITKIVTALVVLEARPLADAADRGPLLTFDKADSDLYDKYYLMGATIRPMPTGSVMSQRDALSTMLIPSASNYAEAVSTWAFGSQGAFLSAARGWLSANGLSQTTIVEPTGLNPRNVSTPTDLLALGKIAAAHPALAAIVATPSASVSGPGQLINTNTLLGRNGITGLKTGNLGENSYNLLYTASLDVDIDQPLAVTGVVLGGASREAVNAGVLTLLDGIRAGFHRVPLAARGDEVGTITTAWGASASLFLSDNASIYTWSDTPIEQTMQVTEPAEYDDGVAVGTVTWTAGPHTVTAPVEIEGSIEPPTVWWRLTHPLELGGR